MRDCEGREEWLGGGNWSLVYNALSFGIASMGSAMIYVWLMIGNARTQRIGIPGRGESQSILQGHLIR